MKKKTPEPRDDGLPELIDLDDDSEPVEVIDLFPRRETPRPGDANRNERLARAIQEGRNRRAKLRKNPNEQRPPEPPPSPEPNDPYTVGWLHRLAKVINPVASAPSARSMRPVAGSLSSPIFPL